MADAQEKHAEALEAATQEQMAKFDEALEEQQALEQWLRRVPDDPGGLLRRKFRYQTMQRLREGEEPDESIRW
jgi:Ca-activated chloride channel family protein